jgi:hypothetical protein
MVNADNDCSACLGRLDLLSAQLIAHEMHR